MFRGAMEEIGALRHLGGCNVHRRELDASLVDC